MSGNASCTFTTFTPEDVKRFRRCPFTQSDSRNGPRIAPGTGVLATKQRAFDESEPNAKSVFSCTTSLHGRHPAAMEALNGGARKLPP